MLILSESASPLKKFLARTALGRVAQTMLLRMALAFMMHKGRMSCSQAAAMIASQTVHRGELTRFLARPRWQKRDFNAPLRQVLLRRVARRGRLLFLIDATLVSQSGHKAQNTYSTGHRGRPPAKKRRYNKKKIVFKKCHSFTFGLLITPSGMRIPYQRPHYTPQYCQQEGLTPRTTAQAAAEMITELELPQGADVVVIGDAAYDAAVVQKACPQRGYLWITPANSERVYQGPQGQRPRLRSRLKEWESLPCKRIRLRASTGKYASYRRISKWRLGPKIKPRTYYAYQEKRQVRNVGYVQLVFSTTKADLQSATADDVKLLMTNATSLSATEVIELYSLRWQIELFFKELKSRFGFAQYSFHRFGAVQGWVEIAITTVLFLEEQRARRLQDKRSNESTRRWWQSQRLHGLSEAFEKECKIRELKYLADRLQTPGGIQKLRRLIADALPPEYRGKA